MAFKSPGVRALVLLQMEEMDRLFVAWRKARRLNVLGKARENHTAWIPAKTLDSFHVYKSRWGAPMTVEAMFEHAVAHPMRHRLQLKELVAKRRTPARPGS